jgi:2-polyprenyl-3-methyl-5-hydroxy-6-metoxy-1,4-benzoquinol methylase
MKTLFSQRARGEEYLDNPNVHGEDLEQNLKELRFINHTLGGNQVTLQALRKVLASKNQPKWFIADLGCGGGDILLLIAKEMRKQRKSFSLAGIDMNEYTLRYAMLNTFDYEEIRYCLADILSEEFDASSFDIVNATLFCHHFSEEELIHLFKKLRQQVHVAVILNDLHRHSLAYYSIKFLTRLFSKSYMVKHDAPLSVLRGFSKSEIQNIALNAGFSKIEIRWCWAFRWKVILWV